MLEKLISTLFIKKPQSKKHFTVKREKSNQFEKNVDGQSSNSKMVLLKQKSTRVNIQDRGRIYNLLFNACSQR